MFNCKSYSAYIIGLVITIFSSTLLTSCTSDIDTSKPSNEIEDEWEVYYYKSVCPDSLRLTIVRDFNQCVKNANNMSDEEMEDVIPECRESIYEVYCKEYSVIRSNKNPDIQFCCYNTTGERKKNM